MPRVTVSQATIDWLLSEDNPPVRYLTLTRLLGRSPRSPEVHSAAAQLGTYRPTQRILAQCHRFWRPRTDLYEQYRGGFWQLVFLHEYRAPASLPGIREGIEFLLSLLEHSRPDRPLYGIHCLNANLLRAMVGLGFGADTRVRGGLDLVAEQVIASGGVPCVIADWSVYPTCSMSLPKVLLALTALPAATRSPHLQRAAAVCVERLLDHRIQRYVSPIASEWNTGGRERSGLPEPSSFAVIRDPVQRARAIALKQEFVRSRGGLGELAEKDGWGNFGFPQSYDSDLLEAMRALAQAGAPKRADALTAGLDAIVAKRRPDGRWNLDSSLNSTMRVAVERRGRASRWITFHALSVLRYFRGLDITD